MKMSQHFIVTLFSLELKTVINQEASFDFFVITINTFYVIQS